jgi:hypothetical protein
MQDVVVGPFPVLQEPRHSMRAAHPRVTSSLSDAPVPVAALPSGPLPAVVVSGDSYLLPESVGQRTPVFTYSRAWFRHGPPLYPETDRRASQ